MSLVLMDQQLPQFAVLQSELLHHQCFQISLGGYFAAEVQAVCHHVLVVLEGASRLEHLELFVGLIVMTLKAPRETGARDHLCCILKGDVEHT